MDEVAEKLDILQRHLSSYQVGLPMRMPAQLESLMTVTHAKSCSKSQTQHAWQSCNGEQYANAKTEQRLSYLTFACPAENTRNH